MTMTPSPQDLRTPTTSDAPASSGLVRSPLAAPSLAPARRRHGSLTRLTAAAALLAVAFVAPPRASGSEAAAGPASDAAPAATGSARTIVPIDLDAALALATTASPDLAAARAVAEAAALRADAARRTHLPRVGLEVGIDAADRPSMVFANRLDAGDFAAEDFGLDRLNDPNFLVHGGLAIAAELPLDLFGQLRTAADAADAAAAVPAAEVAVATAELRRAVAEAWSQAALAGELVAVAEAAFAAAEARERDFAARVEEGALLNAELLRARAARRAREADLVARTAERDQARATLSRLLAAPAATLYVPTATPAGEPSPLAPLAACERAAEHDRPELAAATARITAAQLGEELLRRERLPQTGLWGSLRDDRLGLSTDRQSAAVGVSLRWSLFDPTHQTRAAAASAERRAAEATAAATRDQIRLEVTRAWQAATAARARLAAAAGGTAEGQEALRVVRERREAGLATLTDELETESMALAAELAERAAATAVWIADAALARAIGAAAGSGSPAGGATSAAMASGGTDGDSAAAPVIARDARTAAGPAALDAHSMAHGAAATFEGDTAAASSTVRPGSGRGAPR
jgi:outer membrane protein